MELDLNDYINLLNAWNSTDIKVAQAAEAAKLSAKLMAKVESMQKEQPLKEVSEGKEVADKAA